MMLYQAALLNEATRRLVSHYTLGFDLKANPIEILYNEFGENGVNVFHATACQDRFLRLLEEGELL